MANPLGSIAVVDMDQGTPGLIWLSPSRSC
jgi:hypothetical protein